MQPLIFFFLKQYQTYSTLDCSLNEMMLFFFPSKKFANPYKFYTSQRQVHDRCCKARTRGPEEEGAAQVVSVSYRQSVT